MTPTQSPTLASQATAELPKLPEPTRMSADQAYLGFTADQMNAHYLAGVEAGRASRAAPTPPVEPVAKANVEVSRLASEAKRLGWNFANYCVNRTIVTDNETRMRLGCTFDASVDALAAIAAGRASRAGSEPVTVAIPERNALLRLLVAEVTRLQALFTDALGDTQQDSAPIAPAAAAEPSERTEQSAFEDWLELNCPSGDVESVQRQWLSSSAHEDWYDEQCNAAATPVPPDRERAASLVGSEDTKRLDWLETSGEGTVEIFRFKLFDYEALKYEQGFVINKGKAETSLRAAIDAARGSAGEAQS